MPTGAITGYMDVAQLVLYAFWIFFASLIFYLRREDKREGYPLESDRTRGTNRLIVQGFPFIPKPKTFLLPHEGTYQAPSGNPDRREVKARPFLPTLGAPLVPTGNPAAYDVAHVRSLKFVFCTEDDGAGNTTLRGYSYATPGTLVPLTPPSVTLVGAPAAYVNRIGVDRTLLRLHVPTVTGIHVVALSASVPQKFSRCFRSSPSAFSTTPAQ